MIKTSEMLGKKLFFTTFCLTLFWGGWVEAARSWEKVSVTQVISSDQYRLSDGRQIELIGVLALDLEFPHQSESCLTETTRLKLKALLIGKAVKMKHGRIKPPRAHVWSVYLKFGTQDLAEFLLREGLAVMTAEDHLYTKEYALAQSSAQEAHRGRWGQCDPHLGILKWKKARGRISWFWDRYHSYLRPVSVGKVTSVPAGNLITLDNGLRVQLKNLVIPDQSDGAAHKCFSESAQAHLGSMILGREVELHATDEFVAGYKTVARDVYLPQTSWRPAIWVNKKMIEDGYARLDGGPAELQKAQGAAWERPNGAWRKCLVRLLAE